MKHTHLLALLVCSICFPVNVAYGHVPQVIRMITKLPPKRAAMLTGKGMESAARFALNTLKNPVDKTLIQTTSSSKKYLQTATKWQREAVQGSIVSQFMLPELERTKAPLSQLQDMYPGWNDFVVNKTLQKAIDEAVKRNDYQRLRILLGDYYSLSKDGKASRLWELPTTVFVDSATDYFFKYGRMTLKLREVLKSPFVDEALKKKVHVFIAKKNLLPREEQVFRNLMTDIYGQYRVGLFQTLTGEEVASLVNAYEETYRAAVAFVANTGRMPHRVAGPQEQELAERIDFLLEHASKNQFVSTQKAIESLKQLREDYPMEILEWDAFAAQFREFVTADMDHHFNIREYREGEYTELERLLYNSMLYHCHNGKEQAFWNLEAQIVLDMYHSPKP